MPTITDIYQQFVLPSALQTHQVRVAAVAKLICDHLTVPVEQDEIILGCLLHDMGNLAKFDLWKFPDLVEPEGLAYWQEKQTEFKRRFGDDEHLATIAVLKELDVSSRVFELATSVGFHNIKNNFESGDIHLMIPEYADDRVTPWGVVSLTDRLEDLERRYGHRYPSETDKKRRAEFAAVAHRMEAAIFSQTTLQPSDITDERVEPLLAELRKTPIEVN